MTLIRKRSGNSFEQCLDEGHIDVISAEGADVTLYENIELLQTLLSEKS